MTAFVLLMHTLDRPRRTLSFLVISFLLFTFSFVFILFFQFYQAACGYSILFSSVNMSIFLSCCCVVAVARLAHE